MTLKRSTLCRNTGSSLNFPYYQTDVSISHLPRFRLKWQEEKPGMRFSHLFPRQSLGHHANDQVEPFYPVVRGQDVWAKRMQPVQHINGLTLLRPLLHLKKEQLVQWLEQNAFTWREDSSNTNPAFQRNQIRHHILPLLENELNPNITETLFRTMKVFQDEDIWLDQNAKQYNATNIATAPTFLQRRWIRLWLHQQQITELSFDVCEQVVKAINQPDGSRLCDINNQYQVEIAYGVPRLHKRKASSPPPTSILEETTGAGWKKTMGKAQVFFPQPPLFQEKLAQRTFHVRSVQPGDRFQPSE